MAKEFLFSDETLGALLRRAIPLDSGDASAWPSESLKCLPTTRMAAGMHRRFSDSDQAHLAACARCRRRLAMFFRDQCPSPELLAALRDRQVHDSAVRNALEFHVTEDGCERCGRILQLLSEGWPAHETSISGTWSVEWLSGGLDRFWRETLHDVELELQELAGGRLMLSLTAPSELEGWNVHLALEGGEVVTKYSARLPGSGHLEIELDQTSLWLNGDPRSIFLMITITGAGAVEAGCLDLARLRRYAFAPSHMNWLEVRHVESCMRCMKSLTELRHTGKPDVERLAALATGTLPAEDLPFVEAAAGRLAPHERSAFLTLAAHARTSLEGLLRTGVLATNALRAAVLSISPTPAFGFASEPRHDWSTQADSGALRSILQSSDDGREWWLTIHLAQFDSPIQHVWASIRQGEFLWEDVLDVRDFGTLRSASARVSAPVGWTEAAAPVCFVACPMPPRA